MISIYHIKIGNLEGGIYRNYDNGLSIHFKRGVMRWSNVTIWWIELALWHFSIEFAYNKYKK